tara:strand:+ start:300 stop:416 length:117 start_codon:yes stop_codon:yes gene_type:complete
MKNFKLLKAYFLSLSNVGKAVVGLVAIIALYILLECIS